MTLRIVCNTIYSEDGVRLKKIRCPKRTSKSELASRGDDDFDCRHCAKTVVNTDFLTESELLTLLQRVSDLLCMSNSVHASLTKEHEDNDDYEGSIR
jgi:hypothetical protein